jgi:glycosyltransferase involved in cell wall biosynthesis
MMNPSTSTPQVAPLAPVEPQDHLQNREQQARPGPSQESGRARSGRALSVAFCENGAGYGGAVISLEAMLEKLPPDFLPHIYTGLGIDPYPRLARLGRWRHLRAISVLSQQWLRRRRIPYASAIDNLVNILPTALSYYWHFKRDAIDLVYLNNDASCNMAAALGAKLAGLPMVLHARGFNVDTRGNRWVLANLRHGLPVSTAVRAELLTLGLAPEKCTVIAEGLDLEAFAPRAPSPALRAELGIGTDEPVVTLVGGLVDWKGQDVLLDAAPRILQRYPRAHLLLVGGAYGKDREFADEIARRAAAPGLQGRVRLLGMRGDVPDILALSTIVLHASTKPEPFGRTFLEGMALGKAVIASNEGGPLDVIEDGVDGLLIPPRDPAQLADAVLRLLDQPDFAAALASRAAVKAREYSIERHTDAVCSVLRWIMRRN